MKKRGGKVRKIGGPIYIDIYIDIELQIEPAAFRIRPLQVCWRCLATKGTNDLSYCYTNVSDDASWRATEWTSDPWMEPPAYSMLPGFSLKMLNVDVLHVWHLGVARDMTASVLRV